MRTKAIVGGLGLIVGIALGALAGAWFERRSNDEHTAVAVQEQRARADRHDAETGELHQHVALLEMHLHLGRIAIEADQQDYGTAGERAARFFDELALIAAETQPENPDRAVLLNVLGARDDIIAGLATAQPAAAQRLEQLYLDTFAMQHLQPAEQVAAEPVARRRPDAATGSPGG